MYIFYIHHSIDGLLVWFDILAVVITGNDIAMQAPKSMGP